MCILGTMLRYFDIYEYSIIYRMTLKRSYRSNYLKGKYPLEFIKIFYKNKYRTVVSIPIYKIHCKKNVYKYNSSLQIIELNKSL